MRLRVPLPIDAVLAVVVLVMGAVEIVSGQVTGPMPVVVVSLACYVVAVLVRRTSLWAGVLVAFPAVVVSNSLGLSQQDYMASILACLVLVWWVGYAMDTRESWLAFGFAFACVAVTNDPGIGNIVWLLLVIGGAWLAGRALRSRRLLIDDLHRTAAALEASREALAERAVAEERLRIARDIHDVVSHSVTVMLVQAEAAGRVMPDDARARQAIEAVQDTGRTAMGELRQLLGVLRTDEDTPAVRPQPGLGDLGHLLAHCREAGLAVTTAAGCEPNEPLPTHIELTAYRVAQEALTNVLRHSAATEATLAVRSEPGALVVEVADRGPSRPRTGAGGHGLEGMRERVTACGGDLVAGPSDGGFRVLARLPLGAPA